MNRLVITRPMQKLRMIWGIGFTAFMLLGFELYLFALEIIEPSTSRYLIIGSAFILFFRFINVGSLFKHPFFIWAFLYFLYVTAWYILGGMQDYAYSHFKGSVYLLFYAPVLIIGLQHINYENKVYTWLLPFLLAIGVYTVYADDGSIYGINSGAVARRSGNYLNANAAAAMFAWMFAYAAYRKNPKIAVAALLISGLGVLLTLSRGGFIALLLAAFGYLIRGHLPRYVAVLGVLTFSFLLSSPFIIESTLSLFPTMQSDSMDRLQFIFGKNIGQSMVQDDRYYLVLKALDEFWKHPIVGNGLGYTAIWDEAFAQGTHNMMLMHLAEFGITGLWIIPGFCAAMWYSGKSHPWQDRLIWIFMILLLSLFSHNFFDSLTNIFTMTFMFLVPNYAKCQNSFTSAQNQAAP